MIEYAHKTIEKPSGTIRNGERLGTVRNGERSETFILYKITVRNVYKITVTFTHHDIFDKSLIKKRIWRTLSNSCRLRKAQTPTDML
jgi:RNA recognition motif-containing protein